MGCAAVRGHSRDIEFTSADTLPTETATSGFLSSPSFASPTSPASDYPARDPDRVLLPFFNPPTDCSTGGRTDENLSTVMLSNFTVTSSGEAPEQPPQEAAMTTSSGRRSFPEKLAAAVVRGRAMQEDSHLPRGLRTPRSSGTCTMTPSESGPPYRAGSRCISDAELTPAVLLTPPLTPVVLETGSRASCRRGSLMSGSNRSSRKGLHVSFRGDDADSLGERLSRIPSSNALRRALSRPSRPASPAPDDMLDALARRIARKVNRQKSGSRIGTTSTQSGAPVTSPSSSVGTQNTVQSMSAIAPELPLSGLSPAAGPVLSASGSAAAGGALSPQHTPTPPPRDAHGPRVDRPASWFGTVTPPLHGLH
eukprot:TRINITY_DN28714_c0_g1_i1.p1 TRINITY_DN28714_c0_g1~~TRINITY_DN28714_c0_g1_i1.p1  ORF type:complete len:387 (+),score=67.57 TRINITY_DN28714_c0_g1_i1:66-1163(+)